MNWFFFLTFNVILGAYCCLISYRIAVNKRYDLVTRAYKQPFSSPELVVGQFIWLMGMSGTAFILLPFILFLIPLFHNLSLRALIGCDSAVSIPIVIWKQIIVMKHDSNGGEVPSNEIGGGVEPAFVSLMRSLIAGKTFQASAITESEGGYRLDAEISGGAEKITLNLRRRTNAGEIQTSRSDFKSAEDLSAYLEKNTILRLGDFK